MERVELNIKGRVQGVFFRANTQKKAQKLNITGFVRNTHDGNVEVIAEGERSVLEGLINWCYKGPPLAKVEDIEINWIKATGEFLSFYII
ncbi:MAG: acylphosphatase [Deltaproteobacteria bacterium CG07_land_8_20_14_0_80_38_7]|nr:MAG: acylphosphatase [Deltaproteobacteria bacterium CG07_land_8_20_14_0_80_38_7]